MLSQLLWTYKKLTQDMKSIGYSVLKKGKDTDQIELIDNQKVIRIYESHNQRTI